MSQLQRACEDLGTFGGLHRTTQRILNAKYEIRNSKQIRTPQFEGPKHMIHTDTCQSRISRLRISNLFRISSFEFGISFPQQNLWVPSGSGRAPSV